MKNITELTDNVLPMSIKPQFVREVTVSNDLANYIDSLFNDLKAIFTAWRQAYYDPDPKKVAVLEGAAKKQWLIAFAENGIKTQTQVDFGLKNSRKLKTDFLLSVGKFIELCRVTPENLGLPNPEEAYKIASLKTGKALHPVLEATIKAVDSYDLKIGKVTPKQFEYTYMIMINRYANGERLTKEVPKAITHGELKGLDAVLQQSENEAKRRVQLQGISTNAAEARRQALAVLGLKDRTKEARA